MQPLEKTLRNQLERTIKEARDVAEEAAKASLNQLGVREAAPFTHLSAGERELRRQLRAHGRQLGNGRNANGEQNIDRLIEEVAYEHWHRMLFARFLAENNLLMYPDPDDPVAVTLEECEDLAADEGAANGWELAARYATRMLPQIFRLDSPVFQLTLPPEHQQKLEKLVTELPEEVFTASDSLGWVYQFWQAKKKDEVNASEVKIGARELPAVTQLFTEPYMVSFLLDNSLGAWWAARRLSDGDLKSASTEEELRSKAAIPGVSLDYLRFVQQDGTWAPAAGTFDSWPEQLSELKTLDPCCGSGHFLVAAFLMLVPMRMELDNLSARDAVDGVLRDNIHGLELDQRCVELAAFALALTAWRYPKAGGYRPLPELNVACSGLAISAKKEEWLALAGDNTSLRLALEELYKQFKDAPVLGSLINPEASLGKGSLFELKWEEVGPLLYKALAGEKEYNTIEIGVIAQGILKCANLLRSKFQFVVTNPPYLGDRKQTSRLKEYCSDFYPASKTELATVLVERSIDLLVPSGVGSFVIPQNWIFLKKGEAFRKKMLSTLSWSFIAKLGDLSFQSSQAQGASVSLILFLKNAPLEEQVIRCIDSSSDVDIDRKARSLVSYELLTINQMSQLRNPEARILFTKQAKGVFLQNLALANQGIKTGDDAKWRRSFWEFNKFGQPWKPFLSTVSKNIFYSGRSDVIDWSTNGDGMVRPRKRNKSIGRFGVAISQMGELPCTIYLGELYDSNIAPIVPMDENLIHQFWHYFTSVDFIKELRIIDSKKSITNATFLKVPFLEQVEKFQLPKPHTDDPTQWIFHGHPCGSVVWDEESKCTAHGSLRTEDTVLHVAVARLLGYSWPAEQDASMELADEQREWVNRCEGLLSLADDDGIVCIPPVRGEASAADRLLNLLAAAYGDAWSNDTLTELLKNTAHGGKTLETWLREKFFTQHCKLFQHRPFVWHIWDGQPDGFAALVNYHKLDTKLLETLIYTYLGDWISRQKQDIESGIDGAQEKLAAAETLKKKLELILEGEEPYDIFVRWKPLEQQPIGWDPDLNDGVRLNIRPFLTVPDVGKKGAGVLRDKPNVKWTKDRGKDVASAPWYHLGPEYEGKEGDRINDHHLNLVEKRKADNL